MIPYPHPMPNFSAPHSQPRSPAAFSAFSRLKFVVLFALSLLQSRAFDSFRHHRSVADVQSIAIPPVAHIVPSTKNHPLTPTAGISSFLDLPTEILENIVTFSLPPSTPDESTKTWKSNTPRRSPHCLLVHRLQRLTACKKLYDMAFPTYFRHTRLSVIVPKDGIIFGTSQSRRIYFDNAIKLRLEVDNIDEVTVGRLHHILTTCKKLTEVTVALPTLNKKAGEWFYAQITKIVRQMTTDTEHRTRIRMETKAEHHCVMSMRKKAEISQRREHRLVVRAERQAERARAQEYDASEVICCLTYDESTQYSGNMLSNAIELGLLCENTGIARK